MTYDQALSEGHSRLVEHRCEGADPQHESIDLLLFTANISREQLLLRGRNPIPATTLRRYRSIIKRRLNHTPIAHLLGTANFMGRDFSVTSATLIPRPATELLLTHAFSASSDFDLVIDVGTGSGCIAISAALALPHATVIATDRSLPALRIARKNARANHATINLAHGDLITPARKELIASSHALLIANLPYIPSTAYKQLSLDIRRNEPRSALVGGKDGLTPYRKLLAQISKLKTRPAITLVCEILPSQYTQLSKYIKKVFPSSLTKTITTGDNTIIGTITTIKGNT